MLLVRGVAVAALMALCAVPSTALAHEGNPNYRSQVRAVVPAIEGLEVRVVNYDDRVELRNDSGRTVLVEGYRGEPYLRFDPEGRVEVNRRSPAAYLNEDRFAQVEVPDDADPKATPEWEVVARNGRYEWHDHRIHWMAKSLPPQVRETEEARTKVFDWRLPVVAAGGRAVVRGDLIWLGEDSGGFPLAAPISLGGALVAGVALVVFVRRRRRRAAAPEEEAEAW